MLKLASRVSSVLYNQHQGQNKRRFHVVSTRSKNISEGASAQRKNLRNAIRVKEALERIPKQNKPLGEVVDASKVVLSTRYGMQIYSVAFLTRQKTQSTRIAKKEIFHRCLPDLWPTCSDAAFGDQNLLETVVDPKIRIGRDLGADYFQLDPKLIEHVEQQWGEYFFPVDVKAVPYKINMYKKGWCFGMLNKLLIFHFLGGKFERHKDTPDKDLVGTFLLSISQHRKKYVEGLHVFEGNTTSKWYLKSRMSLI
jgi:hypothetical protein